MWAIALLSFTAGALAVALYPYTAIRKAIKCAWRFAHTYYKLIWFVLYVAYFIWCVVYEYRTGRFGGEGFLLVLIPFFAYLAETKRRKENSNDGK